ncbi:hypothetical protein SH584_08540 [Sphingomonas sp. LY29]|nr:MULTISPECIES: hypothetical protein [unclassified Sphingomonas]MEA1072231.1 hypothetical protein [Sphingomonas sp. LY160]WRP25097.1 hypothetical protein SH584_08540 [Sphingomonas sp. LY29]
MSIAAPRPDAKTLRSMAEKADDPVIAQALRDLAAEYERMARERAVA